MANTYKWPEDIQKITKQAMEFVKGEGGKVSAKQIDEFLLKKNILGLKKKRVRKIVEECKGQLAWRDNKTTLVYLSQEEVEQGKKAREDDNYGWFVMTNQVQEFLNEANGTRSVGEVLHHMYNQENKTNIIDIYKFIRKNKNIDVSRHYVRMIQEEVKPDKDLKAEKTKRKEAEIKKQKAAEAVKERKQQVKAAMDYQKRQVESIRARRETENLRTSILEKQKQVLKRIEGRDSRKRKVSPIEITYREREEIRKRQARLFSSSFQVVDQGRQYPQYLMSDAQQMARLSLQEQQQQQQQQLLQQQQQQQLQLLQAQQQQAQLQQQQLQQQGRNNLALTNDTTHPYQQMQIFQQQQQQGTPEVYKNLYQGVEQQVVQSISALNVLAQRINQGAQENKEEDYQYDDRSDYVRTQQSNQVAHQVAQQVAHPYSQIVAQGVPQQGLYGQVIGVTPNNMNRVQQQQQQQQVVNITPHKPQVPVLNPNPFGVQQQALTNSYQSNYNYRA